MKTNDKGIELIQRYESLQLEAYLCPAGIPTIGYGHTKGAKMGTEISEGHALEMLHDDIEEFEKQVSALLQGNEIMIGHDEFADGNEFAAIVCLVFNIGIGAFKKSKTFQYLKDGRFVEMQTEWLDFNKAGGKYLKGLWKRRAEEINLFFDV